MALSPETMQGAGEILSMVVLSGLSAFGGYKARGSGRRTVVAEPTPCGSCGKPHEDIMIAISKIPDIHENIKEFSFKFDTLMDQAFSIMRAHDRNIGRLQGIFGQVDDDTRGHKV